MGKSEGLRTYLNSAHVDGYEQVGNVLLEYRESKGLCQWQVGKRIGMDKKTVRLMEYSDGNYGSIKALLMLLQEYKVKPSEFFARVEELSKK